MTFIFFGNQRYLKSGLSCIFMLFDLSPHYVRTLCSDGVLYRYLWSHMMRNHRNQYLKASWHNVVCMWDRISSSYRFIMDDVWSVIVQHHWDVVSTSSTLSNLKDGNIVFCSIFFFALLHLKRCACSMYSLNFTLSIKLN